MRKHCSQPKTIIQKRNHQKKDGSVKRKNIFQLVKPLEKSTVTYLDITNDHFTIEFAENLLFFLEKKYPKHLKKLVFSDTDSVTDLISSLLEVYEHLNLIVKFSSDDFSKSSVKVLYPIEFDFVWHLFEFRDIDYLKAPEMKLGFALLLEKYSKTCLHEPLSSKFEDIHDNPYAGELEYCETIIDENEDAGYDPEENLPWNNDEEMEYFRKQRAEYKEILKQPKSFFFDYVPKSKKEMDFKKFIAKGIQDIKFDSINSFLDNEPVECTSFRESFIILFSLDSCLVESSYYENINMTADNGVTSPCGYFEVSEGKIKNMTPKSKIQEFKDASQYVYDFYKLHFNQLTK